MDCGINSGMMLIHPDMDLFSRLVAYVANGWDHATNTWRWNLVSNHGGVCGLAADRLQPGQASLLLSYAMSVCMQPCCKSRGRPRYDCEPIAMMLQAEQDIIGKELRLPILAPNLQIYPDMCDRFPKAEEAYMLRRVNALHFTWGPKGPW